MGCCVGGLAKSQSANDRILGPPKKRNIGQLSIQKKRQWSSSPEPEVMENNVSNSLSLVTNVSSCPTTVNDETKLLEENANNVSFVNQGAIAWNEMRRAWVGDRSKKPHRAPREPTISWCATYEDLLSTNRPFPQPIPVSEMVDFLVDIWQEEGLYD
ncbi:uncharacterized protein LOC135673634 [Musa acuminata AAA Group]|uniref:uncharacterized protein LOC103984470 n=1 Tax=Musa acuminata AAA Group TaxID=214697 RepID=UPI0031DCB2B0